MNAPVSHEDSTRAADAGGAASDADHAAVEVRVLGGRLCLTGPASTPVTLTQCDGTTCGATSVLAAGLVMRGVPGLVARAGSGGAADLTTALAGCIRRLQRAMNRAGGGPLGPLPWTRLLGSTPWAVAGAMTGLGLTAAPYRVDWVDDRGPHWPEAVGRLGRILADCVSALLLAGGPLRLRARAVSPAIPRHYVLALPAERAAPAGAGGGRDPGPGRAWIYDPASGMVEALDLLTPRDPSHPAPRQLGHWPRVLALIAPGPPRSS